MKRLNFIEQLRRYHKAAMGVALVLSAALAGASGFSDTFSDDPQVRNAIDTMEKALESAVTKGKITRGASGTMAEFLLNADGLACDTWVLSFNLRYRNLVINDAPAEVQQAAWDLKAKIEYACRKVRDPDTWVDAGSPGTKVGDGGSSGGSSGGATGSPFVPRPGWTITDEICWRKCTPERQASIRASHELVVFMTNYALAQSAADQAKKDLDQAKKDLENAR